MNRLVITLLSVLLFVPSARSETSVTYEPDDSLLICKLLEQAAVLPRTTNFPLHFARQFLDRPYVAHTLEVGDTERLVVNTRQLDCTTLVETVTALTLCVYRNLYGWRDYLNALMELRYRGGTLDGYVSRLHYFTDWIADNTRLGLVEETQQPNPPFTAVQQIRVSYMSQHPEAYKALRAQPQLVPQIRATEEALARLEFRYIPKREVQNTAAMRRAVADGDIIAITCKKPGLDIAHLGFAVWRADGLHLLNASQLHKCVVEEPMTLGQYLQQHPSHTGIRVIKITK